MAKQYFKLENKVDNLLLDHPSDQKIKELISLFTKEQVLYSYFFKRIDNIDWFQFLKKADLFNIKYVPKNIKTEEVIQLPIWSLLIYLEKISKKTKEEINIIDDILEIITNLSEKRKKNESFDNYRNWYHIIRILCNLPNNKISIKILKYINIWLDSKFDSLLLVSSLLKELLPKFINKKSTKADIKKAESIFLQILEPKQTVYKSLNKFGHSPKIKLNLLESFLDKELFVLFAEKCSSQFVLKLSDYLENIIIYECFNSSLPFNINSDKYVIAFELNFQKKLTLIIKDSNQKEKLKLIIDDFTNYDKKSLLTYFNRQLQSVNNNSSKKFEDIINQKIDNFLNYYTGIKRLKETELTDAHTFIQTIIILIKDILKTKLIKDTKVIDVVSLKYSGNDYYCPIFKRIVILFASYDWEKFSHYFWDIIKKDDPDNYITQSEFFHELYDLLYKNNEFFNQTEIQIIEDIITLKAAMYKSDNYPIGDKYWSFGWYCALRNNVFFKSKYEKYKKILGIDCDVFEEKLKKTATARIGEISPYSFEKLNKLSNARIAKLIKEYKKDDSIKDDTHGGFATEIRKLILNNPTKFVEDLDVFKDTPYLYAYHIFSGLRDAWKDKKEFNWNNVLNFINSYLINIDSDERKLVSKSLSTADKKSVLGAVAELLQEGCRNDEWSIAEEKLPLVKEIILRLFEEIKTHKIEEKDIWADFITYSLNSTEGKVLTALIEYSLRKARSSYKGTQMGKNRWERDMMNIYEKMFCEKIIDAYILLGFYFYQFLYLDSNWLKLSINKILKLEDRYQRSFFNAYIFNRPTDIEEIHDVLLPHYIHNIKSKYISKGLSGGSMVDHLIAFYFWDYIDLNKGSILNIFITTYEPSSIIELIRTISREKVYKSQLKPKDRIKFDNKIIALWRLIHKTYELRKDKESIKVISDLSHLLKLFDDLNSDLEELLIISANVIHYNYNSETLIEELNRIRKLNTEKSYAKYIATVFYTILQYSTPDPYPNDELIELVEYIYEKGQKDKADEICNEYGKRGYGFLKETWQKNQ